MDNKSVKLIEDLMETFMAIMHEKDLYILSKAKMLILISYLMDNNSAITPQMLQDWKDYDKSSTDEDKEELFSKSKIYDFGEEYNAKIWKTWENYGMCSPDSICALIAMENNFRNYKNEGV